LINPKLMEPVHVARATLLLTLAQDESNWLDEQERPGFAARPVFPAV
jgi:hypothetical protein